MNCQNCKKDLVVGTECDNAACVDIRRSVTTPVVEAPVKETVVEKVKRVVKRKK